MLQTIAQGDTLYLGVQGETLARRIQIPVGDWIAAYGGGTFQLLVQRNGDSAPYPAAVSTDGDSVCWDVTEIDTAVSGDGRAELLYYAGGTLAKSRVWNTVTSPALGEAGDVPEPEEGWLAAVLEASANAKSAAERAEAAANRAETGGGSVPSGGGAGQVLMKFSDAEGDYGWSDIPSYYGLITWNGSFLTVS